jgi:hypothetical protein
LQVVDDDLVAAVGTEGCLYGLGDGAASIDVADDGAIFCVVAVRVLAIAGGGIGGGGVDDMEECSTFGSRI